MMQDPQDWQAQLAQVIQEAREGAPETLAMLAGEYGNYYGFMAAAALAVALVSVTALVIMIRGFNRRIDSKSGEEGAYALGVSVFAAAAMISIGYTFTHGATFLFPVGSLINSAVN